MDLSYKNSETAETIQREIKCSWLSQYFKFDVEDGKTICIIGNCYIDIFHGINYLKDHLAKKHNIFEPTDDINTNADGQQTDAHLQVANYTKKSWSFRNKIIWQYFTAEEWPFAKCNICNYNIKTGSIRHLETHLSLEHPDKVEQIRDEIKSTWLSQYFTFDVERRKTTCIVNNCSVNIFCGINYLKNHLFKKHNIVVKSNDDTNINVDGQRLDTHLQAAKKSWSSCYTIAWQYFTSEEWPSAKCNICNSYYTSGIISVLERHLSLKHPETVEKIKDEIKSMWLSQYFIFDVEDNGKTTCIVENCSVNIFRGINYLEDHLYKKHNITNFNNNANIHIDDEQISAHYQIAKHPKKLWSLRYKKVWRHFTSEEWPFSKCNICDNRFYGGLITKLENHLLCKHPEITEKMRDEIKSTWLSQYFKFDVEYGKTTCIVENCSVNIFRGKRYLKHHLFKRHNIVEPNNNASINADDQRTDTHSQVAKKSWNFSNKIIWQYFTLKEWPFAKCNICDSYFCSGLMTQLKNHLLCKHPEVMKRIQDEIKSTWLSQYFTLDVECGKTTCIVENCSVNIFLGVNYLKDHLSKKHNLFESNNDAYINVDGQCAGAHAEENPE